MKKITLVLMALLLGYGSASSTYASNAKKERKLANSNVVEVINYDEMADGESKKLWHDEVKPHHDRISDTREYKPK